MSNIRRGLREAGPVYTLSRRYVLRTFIINAMEIFKQGWHNLIYEFKKKITVARMHCLEEKLLVVRGAEHTLGPGGGNYILVKSPTGRPCWVLIWNLPVEL